MSPYYAFIFGAALGSVFVAISVLVRDTKTTDRTPKGIVTKQIVTIDKDSNKRASFVIVSLFGYIPLYVKQITPW